MELARLWALGTWSPLPAAHSWGLTHELTLAARLPAGCGLAPAQPWAARAPSASRPLLPSVLSLSVHHVGEAVTSKAQRVSPSSSGVSSPPCVF